MKFNIGSRSRDSQILAGRERVGSEVLGQNTSTPLSLSLSLALFFSPSRSLETSHTMFINETWRRTRGINSREKPQLPLARDMNERGCGAPTGATLSIRVLSTLLWSGRSSNDAIATLPVRPKMVASAGKRVQTSWTPHGNYIFSSGESHRRS